MSGVYFADGFDRPESIAFGLGAPQLAVAALATLTGYLVQQTGAPAGARYTLIVLIAMTTAVLAWGRFLDRPLLSWAWLGLRFLAAPRRGLEVTMAHDDTPHQSSEPTPPSLETTDSTTPADHDSTPVTNDVEADDPPWARWLRQSPAHPSTRNVAPRQSVDSCHDGGTPLPVASLPPEPVRSISAASDIAAPPPSTPIPKPPYATHPESDTIELERPSLVLLPEFVTSSAEAPAVPSDADDVDDARFEPTVIPLTSALRVDESRNLSPTAIASTAAAPIDSSATPVFVGATRRIAFFGLNGGVGRTTLATEVACLLAARGLHKPTTDSNAQPLRVALLDLDLRSANVAIRLGIPQPTLLDYLVGSGDDPALLDRYMVVHASGLRALLGPPKPLAVTASLEPARVAEIVHQLEREGTHFIICDVAADLGAVTTWVLSAVHDIYVVIRPTATGIQDAYRTTEALRRLGLGHKLAYVVNRARGHVDMDEVMGDLGGKVIATIPDDSRIEEAENTHRLACLSGSGSAATAIAALAAHIYPSLSARRRSRFGLFGRRRAG